MTALRRLGAAFLALLVMAVFYVFAVMQENEDSKRTDAFLVREQEAAITQIAPFSSQDARALAQVFGAAFPLPEGPLTGEVASFSHHGYTALRLTVNSQGAQVVGVRPLSAASSILPPGLRFTASEHALFGYAITTAQQDQARYYALQTDKAAFVITQSLGADAAGGFALQEP